jgi:hypothetical protein
MSIGKSTKKKHICPNRGNKSLGTTPTLGTDGITPPSNSPKPHYYNPYARKRTLYASFAGQQQLKPKMSNSFALLQGDSIANIQKQYEMLSDIVTEHNGKVHGSQKDRDPKTGLIDLLVYYEVPLGQKEEVKKFNDFVLSIITRTN